MKDIIKIYVGDICKMGVDAIVNAANPSLLGGGGVDGAIHKAAGPQLKEECRLLEGCAVGQAKLTAGYSLPAPYVIHTVGPIWQGGQQGEAEKLRTCYENSLALALAHDLRTIAFPAISTGVYHYPKEQAAEIAIGAIRDFLDAHSQPSAPCPLEQVYLVAFDKSTADIYHSLLKS